MWKERIAIYMDGANHTTALTASNVYMDYGLFLESMKEQYEVVGARFYSGLSNEPKHENVRKFLGALSKKGYNVVTKPVKVLPDGTMKGNVDVEIAVDMVTMASRLDHVMLFSGDGDFTYVVDTLQRQGIFVTVCSCNGFAAAELRDKCNEFIELEDLMKRIKHD